MGSSNLPLLLQPISNQKLYSRAHVRPSKDITLHYRPNDSGADISTVDVSHHMKYPTVVLEDIDAISNVDCTSNSVILTFADANVFALSQQTWTGKFVFVTNNLGDCDAELERGLFVVDRIVYDVENLVATATSHRSDVASVAAETIVKFGGIQGTAVAERDLILDPSYTLSAAYSLPPDTTLFSQPPYLTVTADSGSFTSNITFSGYLRYNWLEIKVEELFFDIDTAFTAGLVLSADVTAAYENTFTYLPVDLTYSFISVPGILELGPALKLQVAAHISASGAVDLTTSLGVSLADGNVHLDLLDEAKSSTSGWTPSYTAAANISAAVVAEINPSVPVTVELAIDFFSGLLDLSTGVTATPGLENTFTLSATAGGGTSGVIGAREVICENGVQVESKFTFNVVAFVTQWWSQELYAVEVPIVDECYSWE
ncbi:hypothetical protein B0O99DRAFT_509693 [Bisporella sp. PMI_857]|nr:hypothetical protein B0O99DRAFT_509693 [Bisporella sp. PMI_857]